MKTFLLIISILVLGHSQWSQASCLQTTIPSEFYPILDEVWVSLPFKMKQSICVKPVQIHLSRRLLSKDAVGLALQQLRKIYLKEDLMIQALNSKEALESAKRNLIHELAHFFYWDQKIDRDELILLAGRTRNGFLFKRNRSRNHFSAASLDSYELKNEEEFFAVNTELFLTRDDYKCRRPLQYGYFGKIYDHIPFEQSRCERTQLLPVTVNGDLRFKELNFNKLYQVHLLLADSGSAISSRFGHAMLRLVLCAPKRTHVSAACETDLDNHYVLSFRANVTDPKINNLTGLLGGYDSQMHILPYKEVIDEYAGVEKRSLSNYPLNSSSFSVERLKDVIFDQAWTYRGQYKFLSNNCGTELLSFLQLLMPDRHLNRGKSQTPKVLVKSLRKRGVLQTDPYPELVVLPRSSQAELNFTQIKPFLDGIELQEYFSLIPQKRKELISRIPRSKVLGAILVQFQNDTIVKKQRQLWNLFFAELEQDGKEQERLRSYLPRENTIPKGIPTQDEAEALKKELSRGFHPELLSSMSDMFPEAYSEIKQEVYILDSIIKTFFYKEEL